MYYQENYDEKVSLGGCVKSESHWAFFPLSQSTICIQKSHRELGSMVRPVKVRRYTCLRISFCLRPACIWPCWVWPSVLRSAWCPGTPRKSWWQSRTLWRQHWWWVQRRSWQPCELISSTLEGQVSSLSHHTLSVHECIFTETVFRPYNFWIKKNKWVLLDIMC